LRDCKTLLERMASNRSLDGLERAIREFAAYLKENSGIKAYFNQFKAFILKAVEDPQFFGSQEHKDELRRFVDDGRALFQKHRENPALKDITNELREFKRAFSNDPVTRKLKDNMQLIAQDFFTDENGKLSPNVDTLTQFRKIVLPLIGDQLNNLPLPSVEQADDKMAYGVEGVVLRGKKLLPDRIDVDIKASVHLTTDVPTSTTMALNIRDIGVEVDRAKFWFERFTFPKLSDQGNVELIIEGLNLMFEISNAPLDSQHMFKVTKSPECRIHSLTFSITDAKHETAYKILHPILQSVMKSQIQKAIEDNFGNFLNMLDRQLVKRRDGMKQSRLEAKDKFASVKSKAEQDVAAKIHREGKTLDQLPAHQRTVENVDPVVKHKPETKVKTTEKHKHDGPAHDKIIKETKVEDEHGHHAKIKTEEHPSTTTTTKPKSHRTEKVAERRAY